MVSRGSASPHGFAVVRGRGRGYRPKQVDQRVVSLSRERDEAWERAARLTVLAKEMTAEAERIRASAARLAPQTYESLSQRARQLLTLAQEEALMLRAAAQDKARRLTEEAEQQAGETRAAACAYADALRAEADEQAKRGLLADRTRAHELRTAADAQAKDVRGAGLAALQEMREHVVTLLADQESEQGERWQAAERQIAEHEHELDAHGAGLTARAEAGLHQARLALAQEQEAAGHSQDSAAACAAELLAEARLREERTGRETERLLRGHHAQQEEARVCMDRILGTLLALPVPVHETSSEETS